MPKHSTIAWERAMKVQEVILRAPRDLRRSSLPLEHHGGGTRAQCHQTRSLLSCRRRKAWWLCEPVSESGLNLSRVDSLFNFKSFFFLEGCGKPLSF